MKAFKFALIGGAAIVAIAGFASTASAADSLSVAYNAGLASDYVFRGLDQSPGVFVDPGTPDQTVPVYDLSTPTPVQIGTAFVPGTPSSLVLTNDNQTEVFGGVDLAYGGAYAGAWLSNTGPSQDEGLEYDIYAGYKLPISAATLDLGVITYNYSHGTFVSDSYNNYELKAALSVPAGGATLGAVVYWTPDFGGTGKGGEYYEGNAAYTFGNKATVSGAYGYQAVDGYALTNGYATWNAGVTYPLTDKVSLDARYIGTDDDADFVGVASRGKAVATVKVAF